MNLIRPLALILLVMPCLKAQTPVATATTGKPNVFWETNTLIRDGSGRVTGSATAAKPNVFGDTRTTFRDPSGRPTGTSSSPQPGVFSERKTAIRGVVLAAILRK
jgi:hypothetical protein